MQLVRRLVLIAFLCLVPIVSAQAAIVQVQKAAAVSNAVAFGSNTTAGNLLIFIAGPSNSCTSVTETGTNTWVKVFEQNRSDNLLYAGVWFVASAAGGADTVTCNNGLGASFSHVAVVEYSGMAAAPLDQSIGTTSPAIAGTAYTTGNTATTAQADELLVGVVTNASALSDTWDMGWTEEYDDTTAAASRAMSWASRIVSSTGGYAASGVMSGSITLVPVGIVTFKASAGGGATSHPCGSLRLLGVGC